MALSLVNCVKATLVLVATLAVPATAMAVPVTNLGSLGNLSPSAAVELVEPGATMQ